MWAGGVGACASARAPATGAHLSRSQRGDMRNVLRCAALFHMKHNTLRYEVRVCLESHESRSPQPLQR